MGEKNNVNFDMKISKNVTTKRKTQGENSSIEITDNIVVEESVSTSSTFLPDEPVPPPLKKIKTSPTKQLVENLAKDLPIKEEVSYKRKLEMKLSHVENESDSESDDPDDKNAEEDKDSTKSEVKSSSISDDSLPDLSQSSSTSKSSTSGDLSPELSESSDDFLPELSESSDHFSPELSESLNDDDLPELSESSNDGDSPEVSVYECRHRCSTLMTVLHFLTQYPDRRVVNHNFLTTLYQNYHNGCPHQRRLLQMIFFLSFLNNFRIISASSSHESLLEWLTESSDASLLEWLAASSDDSSS